eukprot:m.266102 g.266102  ORF g.266102 m.266102 type:complete len:283 (+) comp17626_c0_seq7:187-1035(+)
MTDLRATRQLYLKQPRGDFSCHESFEVLCLSQAPDVPSLLKVAWQRCQGTARLVSVLTVMMTFELLADNERVLLRDLSGLPAADFESNVLIATTWLLFFVLLWYSKQRPDQTTLTEAFVYFALVLLIEPVISQLTASISSDTIYSTSLSLFGLHLLLQPIEVDPLWDVLAFNSGLFALVAMASRLAWPHSIRFWAAGLPRMVLFPDLYRDCHVRHPSLAIVLLGADVMTLCCTLLLVDTALSFALSGVLLASVGLVPLVYWLFRVDADRRLRLCIAQCRVEL